MHILIENLYREWEKHHSINAFQTWIEYMEIRMEMEEIVRDIYLWILGDSINSYNWRFVKYWTNEYATDIRCGLIPYAESIGICKCVKT